MPRVNVLIYYQYYHIHSLVFINLQINRHSYFNLSNRDIYLKLRRVLPYDTFSIDIRFRANKRRIDLILY